jgi:hypothetical protein
MVFVKHCPVIIFWTKDPAAVGAWAPGAFGANTEMLLPAEHIREWSPLDGLPPPEWDDPHVGRGLSKACRAHTIMKSEKERRRHRRAVNTLGRLVFTTLGPLTLSLLFASYNPAAHAVTITVVGTPGVDGAPGTDGGPGGAATAITPPNSDPGNIANATGGVGGKAGTPTSALLTEGPRRFA